MERKGFYQKSLSRQLIVFIELLYYRQQKLIINTVSNQTYIFKLTYIWIPSLISHQHLEKKEKKKKRIEKKKGNTFARLISQGRSWLFRATLICFFLLCVTCSLIFFHTCIHICMTKETAPFLKRRQLQKLLIGVKLLKWNF